MEKGVNIEIPFFANVVHTYFNHICNFPLSSLGVSFLGHLNTSLALVLLVFTHTQEL